MEPISEVQNTTVKTQRGTEDDKYRKDWIPTALGKTKWTAKAVIAHIDKTYPAASKHREYWIKFVCDQDLPNIEVEELITFARAQKENRRHVALPMLFTPAGHLRPPYQYCIFTATNKDGKLYFPDENSARGWFDKSHCKWDVILKNKSPDIFTSMGVLRQRGKEIYQRVRGPDGKFDKNIHAAETMEYRGMDRLVGQVGGTAVATKLVKKNQVAEMASLLEEKKKCHDAALVYAKTTARLNTKLAELGMEAEPMDPNLNNETTAAQTYQDAAEFTDELWKLMGRDAGDDTDDLETKQRTIKQDMVDGDRELVLQHRELTDNLRKARQTVKDLRRQLSHAAHTIGVLTLENHELKGRQGSIDGVEQEGDSEMDWTSQI